MADTRIEWATHVWNPVTGCSKVSEGCRECYAASMAKRFWGERKFSDVRCHEDRLAIPLHWRKPRRIFVNSMSDLFHPAVSFEFIDRVLAVIALCPQHTFMVLTKRPARMVEYFEHRDQQWMKPSALLRISDALTLNANAIRWPLPNLWLGVSIENQAAADERIPLLLQCPAAVRFVSCEPLLEWIDIGKYIGSFFDGDEWVRYTPYGDSGRKMLDWVIAGGETGPNARPAHPDWFRGLRDQCQAAVVPFFFKSWGEWAPYFEAGLADQWTRPHQNGCKGQLRKDGVDQFGGRIFESKFIDPGCVGFARVGKARAGRLLDGREWNEMPDGR